MECLDLTKQSIIVFVGTVGSGKSTHMKIFYSMLKQKGLKVKISFLKTGHLFAYVLEIFLAKILVGWRRDVYPIRALVEEKPYLFNRVFGFWLILDLISITIKFLVSVYIPIKRGYIVLIEEYIPATISDYIYLSRLLKFPLKIDSFIIRYLLKLISLCHPIQTLFLDAGNYELSLRWRLRRSFDERWDYIEMQRNILFHISKKLSHKFFYINTNSKTIIEVYKVIMDHMCL